MLLHLSLQNFVRRLYSPGDDVFYTAVQNTPIIVPSTPDVFHTAVPGRTMTSLPPGQDQDQELDNKVLFK